VTAHAPGGCSPPYWDASSSVGARPKHDSVRARVVGSDHLRDVLAAALLGGSRLPEGRQRHRHLDASKVGTNGVKAALQDLQTAAQNLTTAAKEQFGPQVAELDVSSQAPG
jgi:hypothetical protein